MHNYGDEYLGTASIATATTYSDNSVYSQLGAAGRAPHRGQTAYRMGIQTSLATPDVKYSIGGQPIRPYNPALILGGLRDRRLPARDGHAYLTLAQRPDPERHDGRLLRTDLMASRRSRTPTDGGPGRDQRRRARLRTRSRPSRSIAPGVAATARTILHSVVTSGTGQKRLHRRPSRVGKDRDHREQRRRLVRGGEQGHHGRHLGWPRRLREADADRVRWRPGRRRHDPGADLQRDHPCLRRAEGLQEATKGRARSTTRRPRRLSPHSRRQPPRAPSAPRAPQSAAPAAAAGSASAPARRQPASTPAPSGGGSPVRAAPRSTGGVSG